MCWSILMQNYTSLFSIFECFCRKLQFLQKKKENCITGFVQQVAVFQHYVILQITLLNIWTKKQKLCFTLRLFFLTFANWNVAFAEKVAPNFVGQEFVKLSVRFDFRALFWTCMQNFSFAVLSLQKNLEGAGFFSNSSKTAWGCRDGGHQFWGCVVTNMQ